MTSGSRTWDNRRNVPVTWRDCSCNTYNGTVTVGEIRTKTWSGANSPKTTASPPEPPKRFTYYIPYEYTDRRGRKTTRYAKRTRVIPSPKPKKPFQALQQNGYSMKGSRKIDSVFAQTGKCSQPISPCFQKQTTSYASTSMFTHVANQKWTANDDLALIGKLRSKIQGEGFNLGVFLGEGKESLKTIIDCSSRIFRAVKALKRGNPVKAFDHLLGGRPDYTVAVKTRWRPRQEQIIDRERVTDQWLASNWLGLTYGIKPLLEDVYGATAHLAYMQNRPHELKYRASRTKGPDQGTTVTSPSPSWILTGQCYTRKSIIAIVKSIDEAQLVGLTDPAPIAYELLTLSFVLDWFIPVGSYLDARGLDKALNATYVTSKKVYEISTGAKNSATSPYVFSTGFLHEQTAFDRTVSTSLNVPLPTVKPLEKVATWSHAASAVALLVTMKPWRS
ncbi:TPA_asm: maturation protein [ssRNA phage SRR7976325_12]|uniref:Maturation protein n=1 Tax=ssRNA phage SRR7976325_12 TaxID=2786699 RepID=A0A8S5L0N9_9VIRU|nr:maturation protein [ssRNA phage SRR7976325_12]DAD51176.1 TPA_asm: maturation protein [ssRNA phage SRR7976325_12]